MDNQFSISFGQLPYHMVARDREMLEITDAFSSVQPPTNVFLITGVRGSGKTVFMTDVAQKYRPQLGWLVVDLNPATNLVESLAASLASFDMMKPVFSNSELNISLLGVEYKLNNNAPIVNAETQIRKMLQQLVSLKKKLLITIDEVTVTQSAKEFTHLFQILIREGFPVYLLMTGLPERITNLQNDDTLTFLYRAPRINLSSLSKSLIVEKYERILNVAPSRANDLADLTKGYPYAFQSLGYEYVKCGCPDTSDERLLSCYDFRLAVNCYEKIWSELSHVQKRFMIALAHSSSGKRAEIEAEMGKDRGYVSVYRSQLLKDMLIQEAGYGYVHFTLPRFREFILASIETPDW